MVCVPVRRDNPRALAVSVKSVGEVVSTNLSSCFSQNPSKHKVIKKPLSGPKFIFFISFYLFVSFSCP